MALVDLLGGKKIAKTLEDTKEYTFQNIKVSQASLKISREQIDTLLEINKSIHALKDVFEGQLTKAAKDRYEKFALGKDLVNFFAAENKRKEQAEKLRQAEEDERRKEDKNDQKSFFAKLLGGDKKKGGGDKSFLENLLGGFGKAVAFAFAPFIAALTAPALVQGLKAFADFFAGFMKRVGDIGKFIGNIFGGEKGGAIGGVVAQVATALALLLAPIKSLRLSFLLLLAPVRLLLNLLKAGSLGSLAKSAAKRVGGWLGRGAGGAAARAGAGRAVLARGAAALGPAAAVAGAAYGGWQIGSAMSDRANDVATGKAERTALDNINPAQIARDAADSKINSQIATNGSAMARAASTGSFSEADVDAYAKQYETGDWWVSDEDKKKNRDMARKHLQMMADSKARRAGVAAAPTAPKISSSVTATPGSAIDKLFNTLAEQAAAGGIIVRIAGANMSNAANQSVPTIPSFAGVTGSFRGPDAAAVAPMSNNVATLGGGPMSGGVQGLLDHIAKGEVGTTGADGYNVMYGGKKGNLTGMTVGEVLQMQQQQRANGAKSTAAGRYQFIYKTLNGLVDQMGIDKNAKFDESMQDRLATQLLKQRGLTKYLAGNMSDEDMLKNLSKEWASVPKDSSGRSYYAGDGLNSAQHTYNESMQAVRGARSSGADAVAVNAAAAKAVRDEDKKRRGQAKVAALNMPVTTVNAPTISNNSTGVALGATTTTHDSYYKDMVA